MSSAVGLAITDHTAFLNVSVDAFRNAVWSVIASPTADDISLSRIHSSVYEKAKPSIMQQIGLYAQAVSFTDLLEGLQVLLALGIVKPNPDFVGRRMSDRDWLDNSLKREEILKFLDETNFQVACSNEVFWTKGLPGIKSMSDPELRSRKSEMANFMGYLASLLSYNTHPDAPKGLGHSMGLMRTILGKTRLLSIPDEEARHTLSPVHFMGPAGNDTPNSLSDMANRNSNGFIVQSFIDNARTSMDCLIRSLANVFYVNYSTILGRALTHSAPGSKVDFCV